MILGQTAYKVWGNTRPLFNLNNVEIHRIQTDKEGVKCSKHKHEHKWNYFFVESGALLIRVWKNDYDLLDETLLEPGQYLAVPPGEYHQFECIRPGIAFEVYWVSLDDKDITRENVGSA